MKISIITCTYNASSTLERTLLSVAKQDCPLVEHIIVDGCSTDDTLRILEEYRQTSAMLGTSHEVVIVSEKDEGLYYAMNKGLLLATGDYILFLNAGDVLPEENTLSVVLSVVDGVSPLPGVLYGDTDIVDMDGKFLRHRRLHPSKSLSWKDFRYGMLVCHQAFYVLSSIAKVTFYDTRYRYSADVDWCIRVLKHTAVEDRSIVNVGRVIVNYLCGGLTESHHSVSLCERFSVMRHHYGLFSSVVFHFWFVLRWLLHR